MIAPSFPSRSNVWIYQHFYLKQLPNQKFEIDFQFPSTDTDNLIRVGLNQR